jgi:hypothetical protein
MTTERVEMKDRMKGGVETGCVCSERTLRL